MSTKNVTTSTNQYDPKSMGTYQALQGPATQQLGQQITNPNANPLMNRLRATGQQASAGFFRGPQSFTGSNNAAFQRAGLSMGGQQTNSLLMGGAQMRNQAIGAAMNYRPLQTGGTQTQQTSGAGTWLAPMVGMALSTLGIKGMKPQGINDVGGQPFANALNRQNSSFGNMNFGSQPSAGDAPFANDAMLGQGSEPNFNTGSDFSSNGLGSPSDDVWGL